MRISATDPVTGNGVRDLERSPFVIEGEGQNALKIYFESDDSKNVYLDIPVQHPGKDFTTNLINPV